MNTRFSISSALRRTAVAALWLGSVAGAWHLGARNGGGSATETEALRLRAASADAASGRQVADKKAAASGSGADISASGGKKSAGSGAGKGGNFTGRLSGLRELPPGPVRNEAMGKFFDDWAKVDPLAALTGAAGIREPKLRHDLREHVLEQWGQNDPEAAWAFAKESKAGDLPDARMEMVLNGLGQGNVLTALKFFETHGNDLGANAEHAGYVFDELYEKGNHDTLVPWVEKMPEGAMKTQAMNHIIDRWARYDPAAAKTWMEQNVTSKEQLLPARVELAESWARVDPDAAMKWIGSLPEAERNPEIYSRALGHWIEYDRNGAGAWLAAQPPGPALDRPIERYTYEVMKQNPADTMPWAESIGDDRRRKRAIDRVADEWRQRDPQGLESYVMKSGLPEADKRRILRVDQKGVAQ